MILETETYKGFYLYMFIFLVSCLTGSYFKDALKEQFTQSSQHSPEQN